MGVSETRNFGSSANQNAFGINSTIIYENQTMVKRDYTWFTTKIVID